jgi:hypothetical protein
MVNENFTELSNSVNNSNQSAIRFNIQAVQFNCKRENGELIVPIVSPLFALSWLSRERKRAGGKSGIFPFELKRRFVISKSGCRSVLVLSPLRACRRGARVPNRQCPLACGKPFVTELQVTCLPCEIQYLDEQIEINR